MTSPRHERKLDLTALILGVLIVLVLVFQMRSLYIFPQPDSVRWWGDETPQMLELRAEIQTGYAHIPTALGSSVAVTNGLIRGNSWLAAAIYGIPVSLAASTTSIVSIGRTITFFLSLLLVGIIYQMLRAFGVDRIVALFAILLLISTRSYFFASHAARLDIAASIAVLAFTWYLATRYDKLRHDRWIPSARWFFGYGAIAILFATLSIHLLTLLGLLTVYALWRFRTFRHPTAVIAALGGVVIMLSLLLTVYALSGAPVSLYSPSVASNQFQSVISGLPILRPFSRSVQVANILERIHGLWSEAPAFLVFLAVTLVFCLVRRKKESASPHASFLTGAAVTVAISWLLFQSPAIYYYVHTLPLFVIALTVTLSIRIGESTIVRWIAVGLGVILCFFAITDATKANATATIIDINNTAALRTVVDAIKQDSAIHTRPVILAQNPAIAYLECQPAVRFMTAHLVSFPTSNSPLADIVKSIPVQYLLLYHSHDGADYSLDYHDLKPIADSVGTVLVQRMGVLFDVHRDYFNPQTFLDSSKNTTDTLTLYRLPVLAR